jgi:toxin ParE1/3/4
LATDFFNIIWSDEALENLDHIAAYIELFDPEAAARLANRLVAVADSLAEFPSRGRQSSRGTREISTLSPYILRYRILSGSVEIIRVRHSARLPDET